MVKEWSTVRKMASELDGEFGSAPVTGMVLGSGLGTVTKRMANRQTRSTDSIADWPASTVSGHAGAVHVGKISGKRTLIIEGRVHLYEGYDPATVVRPIRAAVTWGVKNIVLTNAAGGLHARFQPGQIMVINDHVNLTGHNPLVGPSDEIPAPRFPNLSNLYTPELRDTAMKCASELGISLQQGVYAGMLGPTYETAAEVRMLAGLGADAVGMSTVLEAIAAGHLGAKVLGFSTLTNLATGLPGAVLDHDHVKKMGEKAAVDLGSLIAAVVARWEG